MMPRDQKEKSEQTGEYSFIKDILREFARMRNETGWQARRLSEQGNNGSTPVFRDQERETKYMDIKIGLHAS